MKSYFKTTLLSLISYSKKYLFAMSQYGELVRLQVFSIPTIRGIFSAHVQQPSLFSLSACLSLLYTIIMITQRPLSQTISRPNPDEINNACPHPTNDPSINANDSLSANDRMSTQENAPAIQPSHLKNSQNNAFYTTIASCLSKLLEPYKATFDSSERSKHHGQNPHPTCSPQFYERLRSLFFFDLSGRNLFPINICERLHNGLQQSRLIIFHTEQIVFAEVF